MKMSVRVFFLQTWVHFMVKVKMVMSRFFTVQYIIWYSKQYIAILMLKVHSWNKLYWKQL